MELLPFIAGFYASEMWRCPTGANMFQEQGVLVSSHETSGAFRCQLMLALAGAVLA